MQATGGKDAFGASNRSDVTETHDYIARANFGASDDTPPPLLLVSLLKHFEKDEGSAASEVKVLPFLQLLCVWTHGCIMASSVVVARYVTENRTNTCLHLGSV